MKIICILLAMGMTVALAEDITALNLKTKCGERASGEFLLVDEITRIDSTMDRGKYKVRVGSESIGQGELVLRFDPAATYTGDEIAFKRPGGVTRKVLLKVGDRTPIYVKLQDGMITDSRAFSGRNSSIRRPQNCHECFLRPAP